MQVLFEGCGTALITPFRNGEVDYDALDNLVMADRERCRCPDCSGHYR